MAYLRAKVAPVTSVPPPGRYEGSRLVIHLHSETPNCRIIFTLDGSEPIECGDRDQGYRAVHYQPLKGYELQGGGKHSLTVIALKDGHIPTRPQTFTFTLDGPKKRERKLRGTDYNLEHAFQQTNRYTPAVSTTLGRSSSPVICVLRDVCSSENLKRCMEDGADIRLYKLKYNSHVVSRSVAFERVATPSVNMTMPVLPAIPRPESQSLANTLIRTMTPTLYERPLLLDQPHASSALQLHSSFTNTNASQYTYNSRVASPELGGAPRPQSPSVFHLTFSNSSVVINDDRKHKVLPRMHPDPHRDRPVHLQQVTTDISLFELRNGFSQLKADGVQEAADKTEEEQYEASCEAAVRKEIQRRDGRSKIFKNIALERPQVHNAFAKEDVAEMDHEALTSFFLATELAKTEVIRTVSTLVCYLDLHKRLNSLYHATAAELSSSFDRVVTPEEVQRAFKPLVNRSSDGGNKYPCKLILSVLRYVVCLGAPIPEAPIFLFLLIWKNMVDVKGEGPIGKLSFLSAIDVYRRTRGANAEALSQLQDVYYRSGEWARDGTMPLVKWLQLIAEHCPLVDASLNMMNDIDHPMFRRPLCV